MLLTLPFPAIDPVALEIGPLVIRWYSLAYIFGLILAWRYCRRLAARSPADIAPNAFDDFLLWATVGVVVGGRLGYVLFYKPGYYLSQPQEILVLWQGGMSFHGGLAGVIVAALLFTWRRKIPPLAFGDILACAAPIGLLLGRLANFINGELYGRASDVPWAMVFPGGGPLPRHPSQLYEAALEGLVLLIALYVLVRMGGLARRGLALGCFLMGYAASRMFVELFREPDAHIGALVANTTMGQWLSLPMLLAGLAFAAWSLSHRPKADAG